MLLAIDIGNTNVKLGVFDGDALVASWRLATDRNRTADEIALLLSSLLPTKGVPPGGITEGAMCSGVPPLTSAYREAAARAFQMELLIVGSGIKTGIRILYDTPRDVGADRIAGAAAAYHRYGSPAIVVDFGTATVFDAISADGDYLGGAIFPGVQIAAESLFLQTSQLRRVELVAPKAAIGKNTVHAMQSGLVFGYAGLVDAMVARFKQEMETPDARVIGTGGLASLIAKEAPSIDVVDTELTLYGLRHIYALNVAPLQAAERGTA